MSSLSVRSSPTGMDGKAKMARSADFRGDVLELLNRELGEVVPRTFANRFGASQDLVRRLEQYRNLQKHRGCVNTVSFNAEGDILVSGSDDRMVMLWDWDIGHVKLSFHSGHHNNVFQAKIMSCTDDRSIVTCAADGQVRHAQILEGGKVETVMLAKHHGRAHKLAIEPGSPHIFYTCGEDGLVQHFDLRSRTATELFTCKSFHGNSRYMPIVHLNAITIDPRHPNLFAVAGSDEYARVYDIRKYKWDASNDFGQPLDSFCPWHLIGNVHDVGITGLAFSDQSELLVSYNDENIYLFTREMGMGSNPVPPSPSSMESNTDSVGPAPTSVASPSDTDIGRVTDETPGPQVYQGHRNCETVKGVSFFGPRSEYVVSGSDCGRIFIWRKKDGELLRAMKADEHVVNCIEPHPHVPMLASSGLEHNIKIWSPQATDKTSLPVKIEEMKSKRRQRYSYLQFASPEELMLRILPLPRRSDSGHGGEDDMVSPSELLQFIFHNSGDSGGGGGGSDDVNVDDDNGSSDDGITDSCRVN